MSRPTLLLTYSGLIFCLTSLTLFAQAETQIHACVKSSGKIRIVNAADACKSRETRLVWNIEGPPGPVGQMNGIRDFTNDGTFTAPDGVTRVLIEAWGGGAGGGGGALNAPGTDPTGGGGGGGGYVHGLVDVVPGQTYNISIGIGGTGGAAFVAGGSGGVTSFAASDGTILISADGGTGGGGATLSNGGLGGPGGSGNPNGGILTSGTKGGDGTSGSLPGDSDGAGGASVIGARLLPASAGGKGGGGGGQSGTDGAPGYMIIQW